MLPYIWKGVDAMIDMKTLLDLQLTIFIMILAGYWMTKKGFLTPDARKPLSDVLINFIIPCNIVLSFMIEMNQDILRDTLLVLVISLIIQLITPIMGMMLYPKATVKESAVLRYGTVVSNAGYMGNPIAFGLFGNLGLLYASVYLIPQRIVVWTAGVSYFTGVKGKGVWRKIAFHPCLIAVYIGLILMITQFTLPTGVVKALTHGSNSVTAISMIVIGNILAGIKLDSLITKQTLWYSFVRLIMIPGLVLITCILFGLSPLVTTIATLLAGMPAGATTAILAAQHHGDDVLAAKIVFVSTVLSLLTVPMFGVLTNLL